MVYMTWFVSGSPCLRVSTARRDGGSRPLTIIHIVSDTWFHYLICTCRAEKGRWRGLPLHATAKGVPYHVDLRKEAEKRLQGHLQARTVTDAVAGTHLLLLYTARRDFKAAKVRATVFRLQSSMSHLCLWIKSAVRPQERLYRHCTYRCTKRLRLERLPHQHDRVILYYSGFLGVSPYTIPFADTGMLIGVFCSVLHRQCWWN